MIPRTPSFGGRPGRVPANVPVTVPPDNPDGIGHKGRSVTPGRPVDGTTPAPACARERARPDAVPPSRFFI